MSYDRPFHSTPVLAACSRYARRTRAPPGLEVAAWSMPTHPRRGNAAHTWPAPLSAATAYWKPPPPVLPAAASTPPTLAHGRNSAPHVRRSTPPSRRCPTSRSPPDG